MNQASKYSILASMSGGFCLYAAARSIRYSESIFTACILIYLSCFFVLLPFMRYSKHAISSKSVASLIMAFLSGCLLTAATLCYLTAVKNGMSLGPATATYQMGFVFSGVISIFIFSEKVTKRKILSWVLAILAVALLSVDGVTA